MKTQDFEWNDFRIILAVCRQGSLSGAARELGVNHSTVFRRVVSIEEKLNVRLFERLPNGYEMTLAGEEALRVGERVEEKINGMVRGFAGTDLRLEGEICLTSADGLIRIFLLKIISDFSAKYPGITFNLDTDNNALSLTKREADIALRVTNKPPESLFCKKVCNSTTSFYGSKKYLAENSHIENYSWLMPMDEIGHLPAVDWLRKTYPDARVLLRSNSLSGLVTAVEQNLGVAPLPCFWADSNQQLVRLFPPIEGLTYGLWILTHPDLRASARVRTFIDFLEDALLQQLDNIEAY
jgi:DNA-binding transcriptional LysR family regulator